MTPQSLLIELGCEDLPARYVRPLSEALAQAVAGGLLQRQIPHGVVRRFATPRRLAVLVEDVAGQQPDQVQERRGPALAAAYKEGQPTPAALGFARSCGVPFEKLERLETDKGSWLVHRSRSKGQKTVQLVPDLFEEALKAMDELVPKRMRWGSLEETFVRPVQWLLALYGRSRIPLSRFGLHSGRQTYGHRFHAPRAVLLREPGEYEARLREARVWADFESRRADIRRQIEVEAQRLGGMARVTDELLDEVTALVEWPVVISGRIEPRFLELPPEVVIATIETNQRYFPLFAPGEGGRASTRLLPYFITVANIDSRDPSQIVAGNERVVRPRLSDALFFWEQDQRRPLAEYLPDLDRITYQKALGSVGDKARRVTRLSVRLAALLGEDATLARRAAELCKADLVTRMVFEFPELQGVMGGYYARAAGEPEAVAQAISSHYQPLGAASPVPPDPLGQIVALADKLDTMAGIFAVGQRPSASKDPFGLRRAALGVLRICVEGQRPLDLRVALDEALELLEQEPGAQWVDERGKPVAPADYKPALRTEVLDFILERLRGLLVEQGARIEVINAVTALDITVPTDFHARVRAVQAFLPLPESERLAAAHKRIRNILKQATDGDAHVVEDLLREGAERDLHQALTQLAAEVEEAAERARYSAGLQALARLQPPVDSFFDRVMVMADDAELRRNRVALLRQLDRLCRSIADISCLPG